MLEQFTWKAAKSWDPSVRVEALMGCASLFSSPLSQVVLTVSFFFPLGDKNINFQPGAAANFLQLTAYPVHHRGYFGWVSSGFSEPKLCIFSICFFYLFCWYYFVEIPQQEAIYCQVFTLVLQACYFIFCLSKHEEIVPFPVLHYTVVLYSLGSFSSFCERSTELPLHILTLCF